MWTRTLLEVLAPNGSGRVAGRRCLILAPHPDDDILGCGGTIAHKVRQGAQVFIAYLTAGRGGATDRAAATPAARVRELEARQAAGVLGVPPDHLFFLGFEDEHLTGQVSQAVRAIRNIVTSCGIDSMFRPYRHEYHADHLAAWQIGESCRTSSIAFYEYPIWFGPWLWSRLGWGARLAALSHPGDLLRLLKVPIGDVADVKRRAFAAHQSQIEAFRRLGPWGPTFLGTFLGEYELFFAH